jgi:hypothetical protein
VLNVQSIKGLSLCNKQWLQWFISLVFSCAFLEKDFLVKTLMSVIMNFGHHIVNDKLIFNLFEFSLRCFQHNKLYFAITTWVCEYHKNKNHHRFLLWLLYRSDEYYDHHHHDLLRIVIVIATIIWIIIKY